VYVRMRSTEITQLAMAGGTLNRTQLPVTTGTFMP
jgi:hypothetical protein